MMLIESGDDLIAIDCGLMFPDADEMPGIDYVIPDFAYALAKRDGFRAVFLTHGHEDHIGALPYLLRETSVPVFGTPLTLALVAERLREHGLYEGADLRTIRPRDRIEIGPFTVEPIRVTHSIVDGIGLAVGTPVGTIVHTGDFKLDPSPLDGEPPDYRRFAELGGEGVLVLCSDSTNVDRPGHTRSEVEVGRALTERFARAPGRIIVATFASHIHRIQQVLTLAATQGRRVALLGMSMQKNVAIAAELGYLGVPADLLVPLEELASLEPARQVILSTGSQGEPNSALALMAVAEHKYVQVQPGDLVIISARVIPGNERTIGAVVPRDRQLLAEDGLIAVSVAVNRAGAVVAGPAIASRGFVYVKENEALLEELRAVVLAAVAEGDTEGAFDREIVGARVRTAVRHFVNQRFRRKPVVLPIILEV